MDINIKSIWRVRIDGYLDSIPIISTVNNLIDIFQKFINRHVAASAKTHYYRHLADKSYGRCIALCIPVLGQIGVYLYDKLKSCKANRLWRQGNYERAAALGSVKALTYLARAYEIGDQEVEKNVDRANYFYKRAADKGDLSGLLNEIGLLEDKDYEQLFPKREDLKKFLRFATRDSFHSVRQDVHSFVITRYGACYKKDYTGIDSRNRDVVQKILKICNRLTQPKPSIPLVDSPYKASLISLRQDISAKLEVV